MNPHDSEYLEKLCKELTCIRLLLENYIAEQDKQTYNRYIQDRRSLGYNKEGKL